MNSRAVFIANNTTAPFRRGILIPPDKIQALCLNSICCVLPTAVPVISRTLLVKKKFFSSFTQVQLL